jgi:hypothetical protein
MTTTMHFERTEQTIYVMIATIAGEREREREREREIYRL